MPIVCDLQTTRLNTASDVNEGFNWSESNSVVINMALYTHPDNLYHLFR